MNKNRIEQALSLVQQMISTLAQLETRIQIVNDYDLDILRQANNNLEAFLDKQLYTEETNL